MRDDKEREAGGLADDSVDKPLPNGSEKPEGSQESPAKDNEGRPEPT